MNATDAAVLLKSGRLEEAYSICQALLSGGEQPAILAIAARALIGLGRRDEAHTVLERLRGALATGQGRPRDFHDLGMGLRALGDLEGAANALGEAVSRRDDVGLPFLKHAEVLLALGREEQAGEAAERAYALAPETADFIADTAVALHRSGRLDTACKGYERALALAPDWSFLYSNWAAALMTLEQPEAAERVCERWLKQCPGNIEALAFHAVTLAETGSAEADRLLDFDRFVTSVRIDVPEGYDTLEDFNAALEAHVLAHRTLKTPDLDHPTYHDPSLKITAEILDDNQGPVADLQVAMRKAVAGYFATLDASDGHPFALHRPGSYRFSAWAAVLDRQGNQHQHIHEDGYLSGCYYIRVPPQVRAQPETGDGDTAGGFEVGRPPEILNCKRAPKVRQIRPEPGLMVLFPAYMYHRTIPFQSGEQRICIAFDVLPEH